jgi:hypothetical protein
LLELGERLAGGLRRDPLRHRGLAQAAQLCRPGKDGDGAKFIDGHGAGIRRYPEARDDYQVNIAY